MVETKRILDYEDISKLFGLRSEIYRQAIKYLEVKSLSEKELFKVSFNKWKSVFTNIYGDDTDKDLFIIHTYFALILKFLSKLYQLLLSLSLLLRNDDL